MSPAWTSDADSIDLNSDTLYVNEPTYTEGTSSSGSAIEVTITHSGGMGVSDGMGVPPDGESDDTPPEKP